MTTYLQLQDFVTADNITVLNGSWLSLLSPAASFQHIVVPVANEPFTTRRDALVILRPVEREGKKNKQLGKKYGPCTSFCCGVIRHSLSIDCADPFSEGYCYFVSSAQTQGIVSGLIRKQTVKFLFTGMRVLVWASKESAHYFCERACASLYGGSRGLGRGLGRGRWGLPGGHMSLWTLQQVNRASRASEAR